MNAVCIQNSVRDGRYRFLVRTKWTLLTVGEYLWTPYWIPSNKTFALLCILAHWICASILFNLNSNLEERHIVTVSALVLCIAKSFRFVLPLHSMCTLCCHVCVCILFYAFAFMHACICSLRLHAFPLHYLNVCNALYMWYDCIYMPNRAQHNPIKNNGKKCTAIEQTILSENDLLSRVCFRAFYTLAWHTHTHKKPFNWIFFALFIFSCVYIGWCAKTALSCAIHFIASMNSRLLFAV